MFVIFFFSGTFKERVGSVWDAAAVGPVCQAPLCKLEEGNDISEFIKQSLQDTAQLGWLQSYLIFIALKQQKLAKIAVMGKDCTLVEPSKVVVHHL